MNGSIKAALEAQKRKYDEYYTSYANVYHIFNEYLPKEYLKDKIIYLPCDSDESNFTIYLKEHKDELQYKELINTADDYNTHYDLFEKCDVVITNPPFSKLLLEFIPILNRCKKDFFIFGGLVGMYRYFQKFNDKGRIRFFRPIKTFDFIIPDPERKGPTVIYITNIDCVKEPRKQNSINEKPASPSTYAILENRDRFPVYDAMRNMPKKFEGIIIVPPTFIFNHYRNLDIKYDIIPDIKKWKYEDEKSRFLRIPIKMHKNIK